MKTKGIKYSEVKAKGLQNPRVMAAYLEEKRAEELQELLLEIREHANLNSTQVAELMGISQPAISRLEKNVIKASISTLERYAAACGTSLIDRIISGKTH